MMVKRTVMLAVMLAATLAVCCACLPSAYAQWVESPGEGWLHLAAYRHVTSTVFDESGRSEPIFNDGRAETVSLFMTVAAGLFRGVDAWAQVPVHRLAFDDNTNDRLRTGIGDPRLFVRVGPMLFGVSTIPIAVRGGVKGVGGDFPVDAEIIPLGEGQRDWELMLELGHSFHPFPVYAMGWIGYRWREHNAEADRTPGNEAFGYLAAGGTVLSAEWKLAVEAWRGETPVIQGFAIPSARRAMVQLFPTLGWPIGPGVVEAGLRLPVAGRNLPTGPALVIGYFTRWSL